MTWAELEKIESYLKENGYRKSEYPMHCNADHYWWKAFGKKDNPYEHNRALWQVFINVYDWRKYWDRDPFLRERKHEASLTYTVEISRTIDEHRIELNHDLVDGEFNLKDIEDKACKFYQYVEDNFGAPPKDEE